MIFFLLRTGYINHPVQIFQIQWTSTDSCHSLGKLRLSILFMFKRIWGRFYIIMF
ncbi:hypothetical protein BGX38DRAFT_1226633 [Terfezia claveryi]|nr:hypothetical protein BGX38DRAFT_1226633 [Terfezia claveryi]